LLLWPILLSPKIMTLLLKQNSVTDFRSCYLSYRVFLNSSPCYTFHVHVTVHRDKFLIIKPTRCTNFSNLFLKLNSTCFGQFLCPSSGVFNCSSIPILFASSQQTCMTYTTAVCTVKNSWWWTEELSETCRISFQE